MRFTNLSQTIDFLDREGELVRISTLVDPDLEMAEITRRVYEADGPAILFENIRNSKFRAVSNLFGTWDRTVKIFQPQLESVKALVELTSDPGAFLGKGLKSVGNSFRAIRAGVNSLPVRIGKPSILENKCSINDLPMIRCWPDDGGGFVLLPQVFSSDPARTSVFRSNLGMYRIQLSGNDYQPGMEIGLHYQLHRGIGNHHKKALEMGKPFRVSVFIGGPPAHTLAAVMPLPEGMPEVAFAGALAGRNFRYAVQNEYTISCDADFCITGVVVPGKTKPEGPFGDHLGYYSLTHDYPYLKVESVYHKKDAIFPFTVVGRPPQEDTNFGRLVHEISQSAIEKTIPGVTSVNAVDDAGVHPLLLSIGTERYLPYEKRQPRELLTHANRILGTGQLSLAKYLLICAREDNPELDIKNEKEFFIHLLKRVDFSRDLHFTTCTTMDTLDYSSSKINQGSKLVMAAAGEERRTLATQVIPDLKLPDIFRAPSLAGPGMLTLTGPGFTDYETAASQVDILKKKLHYQKEMDTLPLWVIVDDSSFASRTFSNFLWVTFLRSNPSHDIYGLNEQIKFKHWGCSSPLIIDARIKPFHAKVLEPDPVTVEKVNNLAAKGGPLSGVI